MKLAYRPEIDGLRAIAVLSVIFYHAEFIFFGKNFFQGGFIGVDFFFVISGYLITSLILKELNLTGNFSFKNFYERRARRILPVLIFVMLVSIPFAWKYLLPSSMVDYAKSLLYSLGFTSNFYFYNVQLNYFDLETQFRPFLHTWSLSVEEQFYVLFPIFLLFIYRFFNKSILMIFIVLIILNLFFIQFLGNFNFTSPHINEKLSFEAPSYFSSFFLTTSRIWEVLAGSVLSYMEVKKGYRSKKTSLNELFSFIGLILILHSIIFFNDTMFHPSFYTISPIIGISLLIWFLNKDSILTKILSSKPFVGIGLISYSLYLWHYPIFTFQKYEYFSNDNNLYFLIFIFIVSTLSYYFIEKPFRNKNVINLNSFISVLAIILVMIISLNLSIIFKDGYKKRFDTKKIGSNLVLDNQFYQDEWDLYAEQVGEPGFVYKDKINILIVGNSFARDFFNLFNLNKDLFKEYEFGYIDVPIYLYEFFDNINNCNDFDSSNLNNLKFCDSDIIIVASNWPTLNEKLLHKINETAKKNNKRLILTNSPAQFTTFGQYTIIDYFLQKNKRLPNKSEIIKIKNSYYKSYKKNSYVAKNNKLLKSFSIEKKVDLLDRNLYRCTDSNKTCEFFTEDQNKIYYDFGHYTIQGAKYLGKKVFKMDWFKIE